MLFVGLFFLFLILLFISSYLLTQSLSTLFYRITRSERWTITILALLFFPGVLIHELAHFLMATILFVPTGEIEFIPQIMEDRVKLGSVQIGQTDPFRRAIIGIAPVIVGASVLIGVLYYFTTSTFAFTTPLDILKVLGILYIVFEISNTMFSSKRDVEGTLELLVAIVVIGGVLYFAGVRLPESFIEVITSDKVLSFFEQTSKLLILPLLLNYSLWAVSKLLGK